MLKPPNITKCKSCGAEIFFSRHAGKYIPLDVQPVPYIDATEELPRSETLFTMGGTPFPAVTGDDIPDYVDNWRYAYRNHFVTCPAARDHRRRQGGQTRGQRSMWDEPR